MADKKLNILVTGATGLVGAEVVRQALENTDIAQVTAIVRRPLDISHPKLKTIIHTDFTDYASLTEVFKSAHACLWCLGISPTLVSKEEYVTTTYTYALAGAKAILEARPSIAFVFLSGMGADSTEKSRTLFASVKGKTENALQKLPFQRLYIARPGGIIPIHKRLKATLTERIITPILPLIKAISPTSVITSVQLAKAMLHLSAYGSDKVIHDNKELISILGKQLAEA